MNRHIVVILHDIRSTHNVGSIIRTAEALGVNQLMFSGYTPFPKHETDTRLPHVANKLDTQINKTALGAQNYIDWEVWTNPIDMLINKLRSENFQILALEQHKHSIDLESYLPEPKIALVLGSEVTGVDVNTLKQCDQIIEIALPGKKESLNVVQAAAIAFYKLSILP